jgi:hypothetical protein
MENLLKIKTLPLELCHQPYYFYFVWDGVSLALPGITMNSLTSAFTSWVAMIAIKRKRLLCLTPLEVPFHWLVSPAALGPVVRQHVSGSIWQSKTTHFLSRKEKKARRGQKSHYFLWGHIHNDQQLPTSPIY